MTIIRTGSVTLQAVVEFESPFMNIREMLPGLTQEALEENRGWIAPSVLGADDMVQLTFQSFIVTTRHHRILVDSCVGNDKQHRRPMFHMRKGDTYIHALKAAGLTPDDIDIVMCTHMHVDHVGWNTRLENGRWVPTFPKARYVFGRQEYDHWTALHATRPEPVYAESVLPVVEAGRAQLVEYDAPIDEAVRLLPTPGHTPGHFAVMFGAQHDEIAVTGDLLHTPIQLRYPELSVAFDHDRAQAAESRRAFLETVCDQATLCCFAHFPMALNGQVRRWGTGYRCETTGGTR
jgi:glyoxylase-like metal-dependent hydrolase (beta-lactamase superfamily II)